MKMLQYILTVQWGQGHHYIERTFDAESDEEAGKVRDNRQVNLDHARSRMTRGAKPKVFAWKQVS